MIKGVQYSRALAGGAAASVIAACAMSWRHFELSANVAQQRRRAAVAESKLTSEIAARSMYEGESLDALREQVVRSRVQLGDAGTWGRLVTRFGDGWTAETGPTEDKGGYVIRYGTIRLLAPSVADWPKIVEAVRDSEAMRGVGIAEFEMRTSGDRDRRSLDLVRILVAAQSSRTESTPATVR
jgi:hypothetical protein